MALILTERHDGRLRAGPAGVRLVGRPGHESTRSEDAHDATTTEAEPSTELQKGLKQRHLTMIAIGGVIGAGLFVGSGVVINETGPAAFLSYAVTGVLIILVMRMLGEMATANPSTGSFADYARKALGGWAGFSVAWLYWYFWVIVVGFEAVAGAEILTRSGSTRRCGCSRSS